LQNFKNPLEIVKRQSNTPPLISSIQHTDMDINCHVALPHNQKSHVMSQGVIDYIFNFKKKNLIFFSFQN